MPFSEKELNLILQKYSKIIEPKIEKLLAAFVDKNHKDIVKYQILTGGKRIRPVLCLLCCQLLKGNIKNAAYPAAGLEILHNYSLIVDDVIDNSSLRRNKPTVWAKFGRAIAQCIAIDYSASVFQAANKSKETGRISDLFAKTMKAIVDGEIMDILFERAGRKGEPYITKNRFAQITEKDYFEMVGRKTAALFQASCEIGGIEAGASEKELKALRNYGLNLGIAFQISDDILDIFGDEKKFGKKIGKDIMERKGGNIVVMLALKKLRERDKNKILAIMSKNKVKKDDVDEIMKLIGKTDALLKSFLLGEKFVERAKKSLTYLPKNKWNDTLKEVANFVIKRRK